MTEQIVSDNAYENSPKGAATPTAPATYLDNFEPARQRLLSLARRAIPGIKVDDAASWPDLIAAIHRARPHWEADAAATVRELENLLRARIRQPQQSNHIAKLPVQISQPVNFEARRLGEAFGDGPLRLNWRPVSNTDAPAICHEREGDQVLVKLVHNDRLAGWGTERTTRGLGAELSKLDPDCVFLLMLVISMTLHEDRLTLTPDDLIALAGWGAEARRNNERRKELRRSVWRIVLLGASCEMIGFKPGKWVNPDTGEREQRQISDMLYHLGKVEAASQMSFDPGEPPESFELIRSSYVSENFDTPLYFDRIGELRKLADAAPGNKASGHWARMICLNLNQIWREHSGGSEVVAAEGNQSIKISTPFTRRRLLTGYYPAQKPGVDEVLASNDPKRAVEYWDAAIKTLQRIGLISHYKESTSLKLFERRQAGWKDEWLDQPLDIRPAQPQTVEKMATISTRKKARTRRRTSKRGA